MPEHSQLPAIFPNKYHVYHKNYNSGSSSISSSVNTMINNTFYFEFPQCEPFETTLLRIATKVVLREETHLIALPVLAKELLKRVSTGVYGRTLSDRPSYYWSEYEWALIKEEHTIREVELIRLMFTPDIKFRRTKAKEGLGMDQLEHAHSHYQGESPKHATTIWSNPISPCSMSFSQSSESTSNPSPPILYHPSHLRPASSISSSTDPEEFASTPTLTKTLVSRNILAARPFLKNVTVGGREDGTGEAAPIFTIKGYIGGERIRCPCPKRTIPSFAGTLEAAIPDKFLYISALYSVAESKSKPIAVLGAQKAPGHYLFQPRGNKFSLRQRNVNVEEKMNVSEYLKMSLSITATELEWPGEEELRQLMRFCR